MTEQFSRQFRLSITKALGDQLAQELAKLDPAPLTSANLAQLDLQAEEERLTSKSGVYQLYRRAHEGASPELVYVGKADNSLSKRLGQHLRKISGRRGIAAEEMSFSCLFVAEDFSAVAPEKLLIDKYRQDGSVPWNTNGFGNNDPGRNRDKTVLKANHFDAEFPIDLDREVGPLVDCEGTLEEILKSAKEALPYKFRYEKKKAADLKKVKVRVPDHPMSADETFRLIAGHLPDGWQIVALMGYVILYKDGGANYSSAQRYYRGAEVVESEPTLDTAGDIPEDSEAVSVEDET